MSVPCPGGCGTILVLTLSLTAYVYCPTCKRMHLVTQPKD